MDRSMGLRLARRTALREFVVTCDHCDLARIVSVDGLKGAALAVVCCQCGRGNTVELPLRSGSYACAGCGATTTVRAIGGGHGA